MQIPPGQRFFLKEKSKGIYSKTHSVIIFSNHIFRLIGEEANIKVAQEDQKGYITAGSPSSPEATLLHPEPNTCPRYHAAISKC